MNKPTILALDSLGFHNHSLILNRAIGAAEYQFYSLLKQLSKEEYPIVCYNNNKLYEQNPLLLDNIIYGYLQQNTIADLLSIYPKSTILVQRNIPNPDIFKKYPNKVIYWLHGLYGDFDYLDYDNVSIVVPSLFAKEYLIKKYNLNKHQDKIYTIYNIIYPDEFDVTSNIQPNLNKLVFASAWHKGIEQVLALFAYCLEQDPNLELDIMHPGYGLKNYHSTINNIQNKFGNKVTILGPANKLVYSRIIRSALAVVMPAFAETFGCVAAESLYLGTPVIYSSQSAAVKEIVDSHWATNYNSLCDFYAKVSLLQHTRLQQKFQLEDKFLIQPNLQKWISLL